MDERDVQVPGTVRRSQAEQFQGSNLGSTEVVPPQPAFVPTMVDARTLQVIARNNQSSSTPSRGRSDSLSTQNSKITQSSTSLQTISMTTSNTPQAAIRRAAWNNLIKKVDHRLYDLQVPVPIYVDVVVPTVGWVAY